MGCSISCQVMSVASLILFLGLIVGQFIVYRSVFKLGKIAIIVVMLLCIPSVLYGVKIYGFIEQWTYQKEDERYRDEAMSKIQSVTLSESYIEDNYSGKDWCLVTPIRLSQSINSKSLEVLLRPYDYRDVIKMSCSGTYFEHPPSGYNIATIPPSTGPVVFLDAYFDHENKLIPTGNYYLSKCFSKDTCSVSERENINMDNVEIVEPWTYKPDFWSAFYEYVIK